MLSLGLRLSPKGICECWTRRAQLCDRGVNRAEDKGNCFMSSVYVLKDKALNWGLLMVSEGWSMVVWCIVAGRMTLER